MTRHVPGPHEVGQELTLNEAPSEAVYGLPYVREQHDEIGFMVSTRGFGANLRTRANLGDVGQFAIVCILAGGMGTVSVVLCRVGGAAGWLTFLVTIPVVLTVFIAGLRRLRRH